MHHLDPEDPNRLLATGMAMALAASGKSRQDIANEAGVSTTHVTKLLMGKVNPSQKVLIDLAKAVDHSIAEIYQMGESSLERERQTALRRAMRLAEDEKTVEAITELAAFLTAEEVEELIRQLQLMQNEIEDVLSKKTA